MMVNEFFGKFVEVVGSAEAASASDAAQSPPLAESATSAADETNASKGLPPALWVVLVIVIVAGLIFAFQG